jgi:competence protein ComEC
MLSLSRYFIFFTIHPLLPATLFLMIGIFFQSLNYSFYWPFSFFGLSIFISYLKKNLTIALFGSSLIIGSALYQKNINRALQFHRIILNKKIDTIITITDIAQSNHRFLKYRITGSIDKIIEAQNNLTFHGSQNILWYCSQNHQFRIGDTIKLENCFISIPKQDSIKQYFLKEQIAGTITSSKGILIERPTKSLSRLFFEYRLQIINVLKKKLSKKTYNFLALLFFGNKEIDKKNLCSLKENFKFWGISHYLARSGLHLIIFIFLWEMLLKLLPVTYLLKQSILCLLTLVYVLFSWSSISFIRSLATFFLYKGGLFLEKQIHPIHAITVITFCSLIINPFYLFFLDFQLSFGITFLLTWINHSTFNKNSFLLKNS